MNTVRCPLQTGDEGATLLLGYLDRQLDPETTSQLDRHVAQCESCARLVEGHRAVWSALEEYRPVAVSADFDDRVMARIAAEEPWWRRLLPAARGLAGWKAAMPVTAAACALLLAVGVWRGPHETPAAPAGSDSAAVAAEAQLVEDTLSDVEMLRQLGLTASEAGGAAAPAAAGAADVQTL